ncbi:Tripartite motif-containing protein 16 [Labeo rohita]|uniref:Tripartite motif-containing protein 16 n=1 Tax=Labeo rohita TaxID=84645 RepID=A0ABQ8L3K6_LABRO|nr:Tripartite motif-containing protein 16 [Labeo rohita]
MAEASISVAQDQFSCPVCLDLLKDPVTIPCGHSYCMDCITGCWNQDDQRGVYSCPQCRQTFTPKPALCKNVVFAEMMEKLKKTKFHSAVPAHCYAGPGDVECDICTGKKCKAVKSCLVCLNSYCQNHLEQHEDFFKGKKHNLMDATGRLKEMICCKHDKQLDIYCRIDQQCICYLCGMDEHKNHATVTAAEERMEKQKQLGKAKIEFKKRIQQKEKEVQELRETVESHKRSALAAVKDSEKVFTELICSIERCRSEVTQLIRDQEKAAVSRAERLLKRLEQEINDLKKRDAELEQLSHRDDHILFLQSFQSFSVPPKFTDVPITSSSPLSFDDVAKSVSLLREKLEDFCKQEIERISGKVSYIQTIPTPDPKTRDEFLQYSCQFTLDPNTVNKRLRLSEGNKTAADTGTIQQYPNHPDRFDHTLQVLCKESVCGRCYWELEWSGHGVAISVSYKNIGRKEKGAGTLSFYNISDTMTLIHRVQTTFTQPLFPGFLLSFGSTVKLLL